jgi:hypothetical protein
MLYIAIVSYHDVASIEDLIKHRFIEVHNLLYMKTSIQIICHCSWSTKSIFLCL